MTALIDARDPFIAIDASEWPQMTAEVRALLSPRAGYYTLDQDAMIKKIAAARWFLLRNSGPSGERWRCRRCKGVHDFFTVHCQPRPFNGLTNVIGVLQERIGADDVFSAVEIGIIEPISRDYAKALYERLVGFGYTRAQILG